MCVGGAGRERSGTSVPKLRNGTFFSVFFFFFSAKRFKQFIVIRNLNETGKEL